MAGLNESSEAVPSLMRVTRFVGGMYDDFTNELSVPARALMPLFEAADQHANEMPTVKDAPRPPQALRSHCSVDEVSDSCTSTCAANGRTSTYSHYVLNRAAHSGHSPRGNTSTACWNHQQELPQAMRTRLAAASRTGYRMQWHQRVLRVHRFACALSSQRASVAMRCHITKRAAIRSQRAEQCPTLSRYSTCR